MLPANAALKRKFLNTIGSGPTDRRICKPRAPPGARARIETQPGFRNAAICLMRIMFVSMPTSFP
jgi:hypothetical protein